MDVSLVLEVSTDQEIVAQPMLTLFKLGLTYSNV
jgi:hypothetical protein